MKKYQQSHNWAKNRAIKFKIGMVIALTLVILAFNYESHPLHYLPSNAEFTELELDQLVNVAIASPPKLKKLQLEQDLSQVESMQEMLLETDEPDLVSTDINSTESTHANKNSALYEQPVKLPLPEEENLDIEEIRPEKVVTFAERMPLFEACISTFESYDEQLICTKNLLMKTIQKNLKYPIAARENGIEATVIVSFVINQQGNISDIKVEREEGLGFDEAVIHSVKKIPVMQPGKQNKQTVSVRMFVPVKFRISN